LLKKFVVDEAPAEASAEDTSEAAEDESVSEEAPAEEDKEAE
jgi:hypothetical protein